jgi:hypothetical protein
MRLFGADNNIQCPRCLQYIRVNPKANIALICKECGFEIPSAYIRNYKQMPPVFVQLFGLTSAGKTTFLDMLRLYLMDMDQAWENYFLQPITQLDKDHQTILIMERQRGDMPGSTQKRERNQNEVYILSLTHMPRWGSRFLVLMDHAGEIFDPLYLKMEDIPFLQHTPVTIFLLSLPDLEKDGRRVNDLLNSYITSLEAYGVNFARERRQLIIVFSKADTIANLPRELHDYLNADTIYMSLRNHRQNLRMGEAEIVAYIQQMVRINHITEQWVRSVRGGPAMINMLRDRGITACFTVMSATGHPLADGTEPSPRRVLDPFFWVMEFYRQRGL